MHFGFNRCFSFGRLLGVAVALHPRQQLVSIHSLTEFAQDVGMTTGINRVITRWSGIRHHHHRGTRTATRWIINVFDFAQTLDINLEGFEVVGRE